MTGREQGTRRMRRGGRAAAIGAAVATAVAVAAVAVAAVAAVAAAMIGPVSSTRATPAASPAAPISSTGQATKLLADTAGSPAGWAPVPYERAQLSVPESWLVESPNQLWCWPPANGMIFVGLKPGFPKNFGCGPTASRAWIVPAGKLPKGIRHRKPTAVIHGIPVYRLPGGKGTTVYLAPKLDVRIGARGKIAARVLATLVRSPLSVVLRPGPAATVPAGWTWRQFGGVRFATPRSWSLQREDRWATCGTGLWSRSLLLIDATKPPLYLPCPAQIPSAAADQAQPGLTVVTGKYAARSVGENYAGCQLRHGLRICLSKVTGQGGFASGVLIFSVSRPKHATTYFLLGLSGSGASARAVFDSIRAVRR